MQNVLREPLASRVRSNAPLGKIIAVCGSTATIGILPAALATDESRATVSKFVMIHSGRSQLIGIVTEISLSMPPFAKEQGYRAIAELDLLAAVRFHTEHGDEADEQQPAVDLGGRVWLGGRPCKGGPTAPASGG